MSEEAYQAIVRRFFEGWEWPLPERADGHRYWLKPWTTRREVVTADERLIIEKCEQSEEDGA